MLPTRLDRVTRQPAAAFALLAVGGYGLLQWAGRTYGSTRAERSAAMPGDELVQHPRVCNTHAITLPVAPAEVWPWLVQVGWGRAGWYTPRWVDVLLFPDNRPSAWHVMDQFQGLAVGDYVPDGPPWAQCWFRVVDLVPERRLVLRSTTHLPLSWRERGLACVDWSWAFTLQPQAGGRRTRLVFRWRAVTDPRWLTWAVQLFVVPADYVMSRGMLRGLRDRVEGVGTRSRERVPVDPAASASPA